MPLCLAIILFFCVGVKASEIRDLNDLIHRIHTVESGGKTGKILGDYDEKTKTYKALGPLQVHFVCWFDVANSVGGKYEDCGGINSLEYSKKVCRAYLMKYGKQFIKNRDYESLARIWYSGPQGYKKEISIKYWRKIQNAGA